MHHEAIAERIRNDFLEFASGPSYPCLGARSAIRRDGCEIGVYGPMTDPETTAQLARDLVRFASMPVTPERFIAFVAMFAEAAPESEVEFESRLWAQLSALAQADAPTAWATNASADPEDPHFAFSMHGTPFFIIGLHPESSRLARRLSWPALVFNPHAQFARLRAEDTFESMRQAIRARDVALQGSVNPNLADAGERSEARQYSGRAVDESWKCPFHHADVRRSE